MEAYKAKLNKGDKVKLKSLQEINSLEDKFYLENSRERYWYPSKEEIETLKNIEMTVTSHYFWHGGMPIYTLEFRLNNEKLTVRYFEEFLQII